MRVYFDTNVYRFLTERDEARALRKALDSASVVVRAGLSNLFETFAITSRADRLREIETLMTVARDFEQKPQSWQHALEVRREVARCRPQWSKKVRFTRDAKQLLAEYPKSWEEARERQPPPAHAYAVFRRDYELGVRASREFQRGIRTLVVNGQQVYYLRTSDAPDESRELALDDPESYWRSGCLMVWFNALVLGHPSSRDYADWLRPYLKPDAFADESYARFWMEDVDARNVPRNRLTELVSYYQTRHKITHGNSEDQLHANALLDVDVFVTADRAFHAVLREVVVNHFPDAARPMLVDRAAASAVSELLAALG